MYEIYMNYPKLLAFGRLEITYRLKRMEVGLSASLPVLWATFFSSP